MAILCESLPADRLNRKSAAEVQYEPDGPGTGTLAVLCRGLWAVYRVEEIGGDPEFNGRAFRVRKSDGEVYTVQLHKHQRHLHQCDCADGVYAAQKRGSPCKHCLALERARDTGALDCEAPDDFGGDPREVDWLDDAARQYDAESIVDEPARPAPAAPVQPSANLPKVPVTPLAVVPCPVCGERAEVVPTNLTGYDFRVRCGACESFAHSIHGDEAEAVS